MPKYGTLVRDLSVRTKEMTKASTQPSKGPFRVHELRHSPKAVPHEYQLRDKDGAILAVSSKYGTHCNAPLDCRVHKANFNLFAASENLLGALEALLSKVQGSSIDGQQTCKEQAMAQEAIAQARGQK